MREDELMRLKIDAESRLDSSRGSDRRGYLPEELGVCWGIIFLVSA
jgi:hypothetical protein